MRDRQFRENFVRDVIVSATLESKPTVSAESFARLYADPVVGMNVASPDLSRRNVFTPLRCYPADAASGYFNYEADTVYVELERQQIDVRDVHPPKVGIQTRETAFAEHWHYGSF